VTKSKTVKPPQVLRVRIFTFLFLSKLI
jgi:hypothetical protein